VALGYDLLNMCVLGCFLKVRGAATENACYD